MQYFSKVSKFMNKYIQNLFGNLAQLVTPDLRNSKLLQGSEYRPCDICRKKLYVYELVGSVDLLQFSRFNFNFAITRDPFLYSHSGLCVH
jgi:hypothetical protein